MPEDRSSPHDRPSFSSPQNREEEQAWSGESPPTEGPPSLGDRSAFALDVARMWVQEHQKATMLGAFAVGVFVGALVRE